MPRRLKRGKGFLSSVNNFLKKYKPISTISSVLGMLPLPGPVKLGANVVGSISGALGYGKRRKGCGRVKKNMKAKMAWVRKFKK